MRKSVFEKKELSRKEMESILGGNGSASCAAACQCGPAVLCSSSNCEAVDNLGCNNGGATWKFCGDCGSSNGLEDAPISA